MEVSFVVPVYNVQDYILECLNSLLEIKTIEYEILVIDDGSTDNSLSVINSLRQNNFPLRIFHQENRGLSATRNFGIKNARGKYISFIDSDDKISSRSFENLYKRGKETNADVISGDFFYWKLGVLIKNNKTLGKEMMLKGREILRKYYKSITSITCRNLYKRDFLCNNKLFFVEGIFFEDVEWMPRVYYNAENVAYYNIPFYCYRQRNISITTSEFSLKKFEDCLHIAFLQLELCPKIDNDLKDFFRNNAFYCLFKAIFYYQHSSLETGNVYIQRLRPLIAAEGSVWMKLFMRFYRTFPALLFHILHLLKK